MPKDQLDMICAISAEALYWRYCCRAVKKKFMIMPVSMRVLVFNPFAFPKKKMAAETPRAKRKAREAVPTH